MWLSPAVRAVNVPVGGVACPETLSPQHVAVASVRRPQVWFAPAATVMNVPAGGGTGPAPLYPQHTAVASALRRPHV